MTEKDNINHVNEKKRVAIYCRVSTFEQSQGNVSSLDGQESSLREFCKNKDWELYKVYSDTKSGKSLEREKIQELLRDAEDRKIDVVVATKLDRLSRNVMEFLEFDQRLSALNVDIVVTTQHIDTTTPGGKLQRNIMLVFAEFERDIISERTREKLYIQAQKGYWGGGHTPLGYDAIDKKLVVNEEEAKIVRRIFEMYNDGESSVSIAEILNREGYKPKERKSKGKIISDKYTKDSVLRVIKHKIYLGIITVHKTKLDGKDLKTPVREEFKGLHEPIVDTGVYNLAQTKLQTAQTNKYSEYQGSPLLLLQKLICGTCGKAMSTTFTSKSNGNRVYAYKCISKSKKGSSSCNCKDIPAFTIEGFVLSLIHHIGTSDSLFDSVFTQFMENDGSKQKMTEEKINELRKNLIDIKLRSDRLINIITQNNEMGDISAIKDKLAEYDATQKSINIEIEQTEESIANHTEVSMSKEEMKEYFRDLPELLKELDKEGKRKVIDFIINEIRWYLKAGDNEGEIEIFFRGNGHIKKKWVNNVNPSSLVSSFSLDWLREQDSNLQPFG